MKRASLTVLVLALALCAGRSYADIVFLRNGGRVEGKVTRKDGKLHIEQADGVVIVEEADVDYIEPHKTPLEIYEDKFKEIAEKPDGQSEAFAKLGQWCAENRLRTQALASYKKSIAADPENIQARTALGQAKYDGKWMTIEEINLARGLVRHKESWVTPEAKADLEKLEAATKYEQAKANSERLRLERAELELQAANAKAEAALAEVDVLREQYHRYRDYFDFGGAVLIGSYGNRPRRDRCDRSDRCDKDKTKDADCDKGKKPDGCKPSHP